MQDNKTPFDIQPLEGYQEFLQTVPDFEKFKLQSITTLESWFNKFPLCCDKHKDLINESWFNKSDYNNVVAKIFNQELYTIHFIYKNRDEKEWYNLITEYLEDNLASFGKFENIYYGNCGGDQYHKWVKFQIEQHITENEKKESLLLFLDDAEYKERIYEIKDFIHAIVPTNHEIFYPLLNEFDKKIDSLSTWEKSRYTNRYYRAKPQISKIEEEIKDFTKYILENYDIEWFYVNGKIQNKSDILNRILFHQSRLSKKGCETIAHKWLKDEMVKWLQSLYTLIESLRIETLPESNFEISPKSKLNKPPKGYYLGLSVPQLETLHALLIGKFLDSNTSIDHFKNAFNCEDLKDFVKLKWIGSKAVLSLFVGLLNHDNKWKIAESIFENCDSRNLAKSFNNCNPDGKPLNKHKPNISLFKSILP
jgi:hypothetical protein